MKAQKNTSQKKKTGAESKLPAGTPKQKRALLSEYDYRIGLTATPERMFDEYRKAVGAGRRIPTQMSGLRTSVEIEHY